MPDSARKAQAEGGSGHGPEPHRRLMALLRPERGDIGIILFFSVLTGLLYLATPLAVDAVVQNIAFGGQQRVYVQTLLIFSVTLLVFLALSSVIGAAQHFIAELIQQRTFVRLAADMAYRLPRLRADALEFSNAPELVNRFLDVTTVQKSSAMILLDGVNVILGSLIGLLVLAFYHPFLLGFNLVLILGLIFIVFVLGRSGVSTSILESYAKHALAGWFEQMVLYPILFKGPGGREYSVQRANALVDTYLTHRQSHFRVLIRQILGLLLLQALASAGLLAVGGALVLGGELTLGQLVASELIVSGVVSALVGLGKHIENWYDAMAATDKLGSIVDLPVENEEGEPAPVGEGPFSVEFRNLAFAFEPGKPVFSGLDCRIGPGERIALTGPIGAGTGTLLQLIYGLREVSEGAIQVNGMDTRHWKLEEYRDRVVLVNEVGVFEGTILDNVRLNRSDVSVEDVFAALKKVGLLERFLELPEGLKTRLLAGGRPLSDSQRIKLCIARAIVGQPRLVLIDKVLDGLDPGESRMLFDSLFGAERNWTLVLATRDRDVVGHCDREFRILEKATSPGGGSGNRETSG